MRGIPRWAAAVLLALVVAVVTSSCAAQAPESFRWVDFHSPNDQDVVNWVARGLAGQKWTAIREIGVQYDGALAITTYRNSPQGTPNRDSFSIWSVSLANRTVTHLIDGTNLRLMDWLLLNAGQGRELSLLYDDCNDCEATTYFSALHYDLRLHIWNARWLQGTKTIPVWTTKNPMGVTQTQAYAVLAASNGLELLGTWSHLDYGGAKAAEDFVYRYDVDPQTDIERHVLLSGREAAEMKDRLCKGQDAVPGLSRGLDSELCQSEAPEKPRHERKPVTTPPANNQGQSRPQKY